GVVGQAMSFDGVDDEVDVPGSPSLDVGAGEGFTLETWLNPQSLQAQQPIFEWSDRVSQLGVHFWHSQAGISGGPGSLFANIVESQTISHFFPTPGGLLVTGVWQHVALTYDKASGLGTLYLNGDIVSQLTLGTFTPLTRPPLELFLGRRP